MSEQGVSPALELRAAPVAGEMGYLQVRWAICVTLGEVPPTRRTCPNLRTF